MDIQWRFEDFPWWRQIGVTGYSDTGEAYSCRVALDGATDVAKAREIGMLRVMKKMGARADG